MANTDTKEFKSGFVTLIGRPNVGKSTLMNHLIGQKIAITSEKPQTTRNRIQTVYTDERGQIIFLDTPGIHKAKNKLGEYMVNVAENTLKEVDVILWLVEPTTFIGAGERHIAEQLSKIKTPVILVINKIDTVKSKEEILTFIAAYNRIILSALRHLRRNQRNLKSTWNPRNIYILLRDIVTAQRILRACDQFRGDKLIESCRHNSDPHIIFRYYVSFKCTHKYHPFRRSIFACHFFYLKFKICPIRACFVFR